MILSFEKYKYNKLALAAAAVLLAEILCLPALCETSDSDEVIVKNVWIDVPLSQIFRDICVENGVIIATCPHVPDPLVSLDASKGKSLDDCLTELISAQGLFIKKKNSRFYLIVCGDPACPSAVETVSSSAIYLKYISAKHLGESLPKSLQQYVTSGQRENEAFIYAVPEITEHIMDIVKKLDVPQEQVMLEVLVVDLWEGTSDEFALDWEILGSHVGFGLENGTAGFTGFGNYTSISARDFTALSVTLRALISEKKASIRSRPRVATLNGEKAKIDVSLDEYYTIITDLYGTSLRGELEVIKSGVTLEMVPHIGENGFITIDVQTEVSDVAARRNSSSSHAFGNSDDLPVIRRRKADTHVRVREGDAIVIGGLIESQENINHSKVPFAGDIPVIGGLFTRKADATTKKEVMIFITPQIIRDNEIAFADRNKMINVRQEADEMRSQDYFVQKEVEQILKKDEEINSLKQAVNLLDVPQNHNSSNLSYDKAAIEREKEILQQAITLLDSENGANNE